MRKLSEICEIVKAEYEKNLLLGNTPGLCSSANWADAKGELAHSEFKLFMKEIHKSIKNQSVFYDGSGFKTDDPTFYLWPRDQAKPRRDWLGKRIATSK